MRFRNNIYGKKVANMIAQLEKLLLSNIWESLEDKFQFVKIGNNDELRTISLNKTSNKTPLVMVHGMGAGIGIWGLNLKELSCERPVYAFDLLGFARSSRPKFNNDAIDAENQFVESIESWRKEMKIEKMILLGHSLGGFLTTSYCLRYPEHIQHLIVVDGWGFQPKPSSVESKFPRWARVIGSVVTKFNPFATIRVLGSNGKNLMRRFRKDLIAKFQPLTGDEPFAITDYLYYCNSLKPSGESAFKEMSEKLGWAKNPLIHRVHKLNPKIRMTMIHGSNSWVDTTAGKEVKYRRSKDFKLQSNDPENMNEKDSYVDVHMIDGAGHHVYADCYEEFNNLVNEIALKTDKLCIGSTVDGQEFNNVLSGEACSSNNNHPKLYDIDTPSELIVDEVINS